MSVKENEAQVACVIYTDGGCRPNQDGIGGWGMHGYCYRKQPAKAGIGLKDWVATPVGYVSKESSFSAEEGAWVSEFTDHTYDISKKPLPNVEILNYIDGFGSLLPTSTNNHAEATALFRALVYVLDFNKTAESPITDLFILADSEYVINGFTKWLDNWVAKNFTKDDGGKYANEETWLSIAKLKEECKTNGITVRMKWVAGHSGDIGNDLADYHATNGHYAGVKGEYYELVESTPAKGYWNPPNNTHPLLTHSRWYFSTSSPNPDISNTGHHIYHIGAHGKEDDFAGKAISDASFAVLYLIEPIPEFEAIRQYQYKLEQPNFHHVVATRLDNLNKPTIKKAIANHGDLLLRSTKNRNDIIVDTPFLEKEVGLTREFKPPKIATRLIDVLNEIESLLNDSISSTGPLMRVDITDTFFDRSEKGGKKKVSLKKNITNTLKSIVLNADLNLLEKEVNENITVSFGIDLPSRNNLAKLTDENTRLELVCWPISSKAIRFGTFLHHNGEYGFWCGPYSNYHLISES